MPFSRVVSLRSFKGRLPKATRKARKRPTLTRERILAEALIILDRDGLEALSMRRLAARLRASPMALYRQDLLQGIARDLIAGVDFSCQNPDWRKRIRACFRALRNACLAHPCAVHLIETIETLPASIFEPMEITTIDPIEALRSGKIDRGAFPHVERAASMGAWDFERAFEFGISAILAGLEQRFIKTRRRSIFGVR